MSLNYGNCILYIDIAVEEKKVEIYCTKWNYGFAKLYKNHRLNFFERRKFL